MNWLEKSAEALAELGGSGNKAEKSDELPPKSVRNHMYERFGFTDEDVDEVIRKSQEYFGQTYLNQLEELRGINKADLPPDALRRLRLLELLEKQDGMWDPAFSKQVPLAIPGMRPQPIRAPQPGYGAPNLPAEEWNQRPMPGLMDWFDKLVK